ncbi:MULTISPECIES: alanyl-tRNA editing protein [Haloferacaceae]|uniref:Alanine--tRNA ligase n=1 Tax=Halorubrum glutamatedens TaxID=2707018 RepID=A0ABD5QU56_9EURY|nr:DHHA1 domain-containing protein [Halobellus captivus]
MTASRAPAEPAVREFESTVERIDGREVVLAETYFYAESGGQPADRGTLGGVLVDDVFERDGEVVHVLAEDPAAGTAGDVEPGDTVTGVVDDDFRTYCARAHTASHVLYGAARRTCEDLGYAGFDISPEKVRVDLTTAEPLDDADLVELERLSNRAVWDSRSVSWEVLPEAEARDRDGIAFNTKTEEGAMSGGESVRVVTVEDWDVAACGGTHVENTAEIGQITALDRSNPGEGVTRVEFAVGPTAVDRGAAIHAAALESAAAADTNVGDLPEEVRRLRGEVDRLDAALRDARSDLLHARLAEFPTREVDGVVWAVGSLADADPNDLREPATALLESDPAVDALAAVGRGSAPFVVAAVAPDADADAGAVVEAATDEFGGGGGGGPTFAQGGGLDADPDEVVAWLRER